MSLSIIAEAPPSYQPYQCQVCHSRFTRHENLKRHAALHSRSPDTSLVCGLCHVTFSRPDLRHRHMRRKHPEHDKRCSPRAARRRLSATNPSPSLSPSDSHYSENPQQPGDEHEPDVVDADTDSGQGAGYSHRGETINVSGAAVDRTMSDRAGLDLGVAPEASFPRSSLQFDADLLSFDLNHDLSEIFRLPDDVLHLQDDWFPSATQTTEGCRLFFAHVSHFVPFLHQPTFDAVQAGRHLVLSMLALAYQYGEDPDCDHQAGSGTTLSLRCFYRARFLLAAHGDMTPDDPARGLVLVQAYLLLQVCAMMYLCSADSAAGLEMHTKTISLARAWGLMHPVPAEPLAAPDLDSLWRQFIKAESHKRTLFAVHQIDALWYQLLSIPRSISHLEIKHDMPCPEDYWSAPSAAEWAHRQLVSGQPGPSVQYTEAVRRFLSPEADVTSIPAFDSYGAINIAQFLISSAREISGWSTMTGMLSLERFEALRSSLVALSPFIHPPGGGTVKTTRAALCEATWETAMIELQLWSPSHTGGIVERSVDAVLENQSTHLEPTYELLCDSGTARAIQPHVDWFLCYLDTSLAPDSETPWVAVYAYKAFLIALQLVRGGIPGAMKAVGVHDGDVEGALAWATGVFLRRHRWQIGKVILRCLTALQK